MAAFLSFIVNVIILLLVLGLLITIHEVGHFVAARLSKVKVEDFAIGMGPTIYKKRKGGTNYKLNLLPIGGYVNILGEVVDDDEITEKMKEDPNSFQNKNVFVKAFILSGGVLMNFMTAVIIYYILMSIYGFYFLFPSEVKGYDPLFGTVQTEIFGDLEYTELSEDGNAVKSGWPKSGFIRSMGLEIDELDNVLTTIEFSDFVKSNKEEEIYVEICEDPEFTKCDIYSAEVSKEGLVGIVLVPNAQKYVEYTGFEKFTAGFIHSFNMIHLGVVHIGQIFTQASDTGDYSKAVNTFSGPVGLYFIVDFLKELGFSGILDLVANLSLTLFIMNILPIPALDGGRIMLVFIEQLLGDKFNKNVEAWLIRVSFILLMVFMLAVILKDIVFIDSLKELF